MNKRLISLVILLLASLLTFSQDLTPRISLSATGDTLFTFTEPQAKELAIRIKKGQQCKESLDIAKLTATEYKGKIGELEEQVSLERKRFEDARNLYAVEVEKFQTCEVERITVTEQRDKAQKKLTSVRTKLWIGYGLAGLFLATTILTN